jgi:hypothetical protein
MRRLSFIELVCIVAIGMAMVEFAAGDRQARETNASVLAAKLAAAVDAGPSRDAAIGQPAGRQP